jgi:hypothetical protein
MGTHVNRSLCEMFFAFYLWVLHPVAYLSDSLWRHQSQQSFNILTPFNFHFFYWGWPVWAETCGGGFLFSGLNAEGRPVSWQASGWAARIVQHEMDHLSGHLYTDIMVNSTFTCTCWDKVNRTGGRIYVPFLPKWQLLDIDFTHAVNY